MTVTAQLDFSGTPVNLPDMRIDGYEEIYEYRVVDTEMADGSMSTDIINSNSKRRFVLRWHYLTETEKNTLQTVFGGIKDGSASTFKPPNWDTNGNVTFEVTRDIGFTALDFRMVKTASGVRWETEMRLRQV